MKFIKKYNLDNLVWDRQSILIRCEKIQKISSITNFILDDRNLFRTSEKILKTKREISTKDLFDLAKQLDLAFSLDTPHGDIHKKNIILSDNFATIVDWEPCLNQIVQDKNVIMYTSPWIEKLDKINQHLTFRTDLLCFYHLITQYNYSKCQKESQNLIEFLLKTSKTPFNSLLLKLTFF